MSHGHSRGRARRFLPAAALAALPLLAAALWWQASPHLAIARLQQAALSGDAAALARQVDFDALRQSLAQQLRHRLTDGATHRPGSMGALGTSLALAAVEPLVDAAVTAETLAAAATITSGGSGPLGLSALALLNQGSGAFHVERQGLAGFRLSAANAPAAGALLFCRDRAGWDLCGVDLAEAA